MLVPRHRARPSAVTTPPDAHARSRGQTLVEFALILPVFLLLTVGIVDATRMFNAYISLTNGVTEGAIYAAQGTNNAKWCTSIAGKAATPAVSVPCPAGTTVTNQSNDADNIAYRIDGEATGLDPALIAMSVPVCRADGNPGTVVDCTDTNAAKKVTITATYVFTPILQMPIISLWANGVTLSASTTATILP